MEDTKTYPHTARSARETRELGASFVRHIVRHASVRRGAYVLALFGDLGSGKTTFAQGLAAELGVHEPVISPTFVIVREYELSRSQFQRFYHIDAYRLEAASDLDELGWADMISNPRHLVLVEWAERVQEILPEDAVHVHFTSTDETTRHITTTHEFL